MGKNMWAWTVEPIEEGKHYGALYGATDKEDAHSLAADLLRHTQINYTKVLLHEGDFLKETISKTDRTED